MSASQPQQHIDPDRLDLAFGHMGLRTRTAQAARLGVSERTLIRGLANRSPMLTLALRSLLGERWRYVVGETDTLSSESE